MIGVELPARSVDEVLRVVRALGGHRYVAGRMHLVHAFAFASIEEQAGVLAEASAWAGAVLGDPEVDIASRDARLWRASSDAELLAVLERFWRSGASAQACRARLRAWLDRAELPLPDGTPFDESTEEDIHPLLVDAGWELLPLGSLDPERHKGAIQWFGDPIQFEVARFNEETAIPPPSYLHELAAMGPLELLHGASDGGELSQPLTVWVEGNETYHEYVLSGVKRAAKLV